MKIAPLLVASATALETSTSATALLAAVGQRNVTHMENLIQGLAEESIKQPAWKFDADIQDALDAIRTMFVKSIQTALQDQHKVDQEAHNTQVKECYGKCGGNYVIGTEECEEQKHACYKIQGEHRTCRLDVYQKYRTMAISCAELHCFEPPKVECMYEDCICPDLLNCHTGHTGGDDYGDDKGYKTASLSMWCEATKGECKSKGYGEWLLKTAKLYEQYYETWHKLWTTCSASYQEFLLADVKCDGVQKEFEKCMCEVDYAKNAVCSNDFKQCTKKCWEIYEEEVPKLQCMEKDRKIDWSATKKIECYLDVLLYKYTEQELIDECGSKDCVNVAREAAYKHCATICPHVDFHGEWAEPMCDEKPPHAVYFQEGKGHEARKHLDQYHLGDHMFYENDMNGMHVHTDHRSLSVDRMDEARCTEHLDIDFQIPPMISCTPCNPEHESCEVCDAAFHCLYYEEFDRTDRIGCIHECCPDDSRKECFPAGWLTSCTASCDETGKNCEASATYDDTYPWVPSMKRVDVREHTHIWAYNRCECTRCPNGGGYETHWEPQWCAGAHTLNIGGDYGEH